MVVVEIIDTGQILDVTNAEITYVKQAADFGNITKANSSYSWSFSIPKNPNNTKAFESLGIAGDTSSVPYRKIYCRLTDNGVAIVSKGLLNIKETAKDYKAYIQEGIVDFYKDVANDKIGETIDLTELNHTNSVANIVNSFSQDTYRYIIADYNYAPRANIGGITDLNPNGLVPSVNLLWLWNKIFNYYEWTYSGNFDLSDWWMTYPFSLGYDENDIIQVVDVSSQNLTHNELQGVTVPIEWQTGTTNTDYIAEIGNTEYELLTSGAFQIEFNANGSVQMFNYQNEGRTGVFRTYLVVDGVRQNSVYNQSDNIEETIFQDTFTAGTVISLVTSVYTSTSGWIDVTTTIDNATLQIGLLGVQEVNFRRALIKYKTADFFKEILIRFGLTAFADVDNKHIEFKTFNERIDAPFDNWSDKYLKRTSETYLYNDYAQNNYLKHKYDKEGNDYADGNLEVNNRNLEVEKTLYESQTYAPLQTFTRIFGNAAPPYNAPRLKMFEVEVSKNENEDIIADYKGLENRFYILQSETRVDNIYILGELVEQYPIAITANSTFKHIENTVYRRARLLMNGTRVHKIDLALSKFDFATLDLSRRKYFNNKGANGYYLLNKLTWKNGKVTSGEFIKIAENPEIENEVPSEDLPTSS